MFESVIPRIHDAESFLVTGHINPEGDCVGSIFGVALLLRQLGKKVSVVCQDPIPRDLTFLNLSWLQVSDLDQDFSCDCVISVDTPNLNRLGTVGEYIKDHPSIIVIDHHVSNGEFGLENVVDATASSCGEMIYHLYKEMNIPIDKEVAALLYIAISTDTGSFRYSNTTQLTHVAVAELVGTGIDIALINQKLYSSTTMARFKLLQRYLDNVAFAFDQKIAWSYLTQQDLVDCGGAGDDLEGFVNYVRDINGVEIAFFAFQKDLSGPTKVSFRSKGLADVNRLASYFNGGGHPKAAGGTLEEPVASAIDKIVAQAVEQLGQGSE